jgi:radical SAM family uncharacterized protein/radical SAM-linked protein
MMAAHCLKRGYMTDNSLETILPYVQKPSRYLGSEINSVRKDPSEVKLRIALAFPDLYDIGTSHFGIQILYHLLNQADGWAAERVFAPALDMDRMLRDHQMPLMSLESRTPLKDFDIVGFSLLYELNFTNIVNMMDLSQIPLRWRERSDRHPLVIAGGPCVCNPEPVADFFDAMVFGDGEHVVVEMAEQWVRWKDNGGQDRTDLLKAWSRLEGVYIPRFYDVRYDADQHQHTSARSGATASVSRRIIQSLDQADFPDRPVIPYGKPIHDRLRLEISRGCSRGCRFCQAGMLYRPVRERSPETIRSLVEKALRHTGYEDISLLSLSTGDYTALSFLMETLMQQCRNDRVAVSLPSLRAGSLTPRLMELIRSVRKTGFTIAPEAGSQRLRDVINKNITFEDVAETVGHAFELGWHVIKLYFMIGLPTETQADVDAIVDMVQALRKIKGPPRRKSQINVSVTTFIPKSHTPFQWCSQISLQESKSKLAYLREKLQQPGVHVKWQHPEMSMIEGVLARGDRRLSRLIVQAWKNGAVFDGWNDLFNFDAWMKAFKQSEIDPQWYITRQRETDEPLPWSHMDSGIDPDFLIREWRDAQDGKQVTDCRNGECHNCGICDFKTVKPVVFSAHAEHRDQLKPIAPPEADHYIWRSLVYRKIGSARFFGHLELSHIFARAIRRAGVSVKYSQGYHPMPKISFDDPLPLGMESQGEFVRMLVSQHHQCGDLVKAINPQLPEGVEIIDCMLKSEEKQNCPVDEQKFSVDLQQVSVDRHLLASFQSSTAWPYTRKNRKGRVHHIDLKSAVTQLTAENHHAIVMCIKTTTAHTVRPADVLVGIFNLSEDQLKGVRILKHALIDQKCRVDNRMSSH